MREPRFSALVVAALASALIVASCGAGVSTDPLAGAGGSGTIGTAGRDPGQTMATGTVGCQTGSDCSSGVCLEDVDGEPRCCEADCRRSGRICSTRGACVCSGEAREVGGDCLLVEGQPCRTASQCASNFCIDRVCCDSACDRVCERCDAPAEVGSCTLHTEDPVCLDQSGFECSARGFCRLPLSLTCGSDAECASGYCELALTGEPICCEERCDGVCQRCGASGACDAFPERDASCPPVTCEPDSVCLRYRTPVAGACGANSECAECEPMPAAARTPCGVGRQCDGLGLCAETGIGRVAAGKHHTCSIRRNGNVVCWGRNNAGQLGAAFDRTAVGDDETPAGVPGLEINFTREVVALTAGFAHTCALFADGAVRCWGRVVDEVILGTVPSVLGTNAVVRNDAGFVDPLTTGDVRLPGAARQISANPSGAHTCALLASGDVSCWGWNAEGQCGNGTLIDVGGQNETLPIVPLGAKAVQVEASMLHTCAVLADGRVSCWGLGALGRLGYGDTSNRLIPSGFVDVGGKVTQITTGSNHTCALLEGGHVRCWGANADGQLGYGHDLPIGDNETPAEAESLPGTVPNPIRGGNVQVGGGSGVVQIEGVADANATCARFSGGSVRCWGENDAGQLGYGHAVTLGNRYTPDQLVTRVAGGRLAGGNLAFGGPVLALAENGRCALLQNGTLYCWGFNTNGELGLPGSPDISSTHTPVETQPVTWETP